MCYRDIVYNRLSNIGIIGIKPSEEKLMKVVCLLSGGMDSTTLLYQLLSQQNEVYAISFNYGSKHNDKEIEMALWHSQRLNISHEIIRLDFMDGLLKSDLLKSGGEIPEGHYQDAIMKQTVVPFRNGIMLSIATGWADSIEADAVAIASHRGDNAIYPDCRTSFNKGMTVAMTEGTYNQIKLLAPFSGISKRDIVKIGLSLGVDYDHTWSCYKGGDVPCGKCGTCVERAEALNGILFC
jgi:7-cyano-7-deazaguanine synthase